MDVSFIIISSVFLMLYGLNVLFNGINIMYSIYCDASDRKQEHEVKNNIPDSVKHLYS